MFVSPMSVFAASQLDRAMSVQEQTNLSSAKSQKRVDQSASSSVALSSEIDQLHEEIRDLKVYRTHLATLVESQNEEVSRFNIQIAEIKHTRQGIVPLMYRMIEGLGEIVGQDKPLKLSQRRERIKKLTELMGRADVSEAEKYRRILEAYEFELEYGNKIATYQDEIKLADSRTIEADILYIGRLSLLARSPDHQRFWFWDVHSAQWTEGDTSHLTDINQAYRLAEHQIAPELLTVPVSLAVAEGH